MHERLAQYQAQIEHYLSEKCIIHDGEPQQRLFSAMRYSLLAGGKRLRPALVYEFCRLCGGQWQQADSFAAAVEMVHTYSLIHDEGELASWGRDPTGQEVVSRELDAITILEDFIAAHPDFSLNGARGIIGFTGYAGILGYATQSGAENRDEEIAAVRPVIDKLISLGWTFASQGYNYIDYSLADSATIQADTQQWLDEVGAIVGPVKVLFYPYGGRVAETENADFLYLQGMGFRIFCSVGVETYVNIRTGMAAVSMDRLHPDGGTLRWHRDLYLHLFDAAAVLDVEVRPDYGYDFS